MVCLQLMIVAFLDQTYILFIANLWHVIKIQFVNTGLVSINSLSILKCASLSLPSLLILKYGITYYSSTINLFVVIYLVLTNKYLDLI